MSPQSVIDYIRSKIYFHPDLHETMESLDKMTMDRLLWVNEQIESKHLLKSAFEYEHEQKMKESKNK